MMVRRPSSATGDRLVQEKMVMVQQKMVMVQEKMVMVRAPKCRQPVLLARPEDRERLHPNR
jgi:hypothetical protein